MPVLHYTNLLQSEFPPEALVRQGLRLLEADFRELALLALGDWGAHGLVAPQMFRAVASLQKPSWGHWNGLLSALRDARKSILQGGTAEQRQQIEQAVVLQQILELLDREAEPKLVEDVRPLAQSVRATLGKRPRLGALIVLPITLRNDITHFQPTETTWWQEAAAGLRPLLEYLAQGALRPAAATAEHFRSPWFLPEAPGGAFNGLRDDAVMYVTPSGEPIESTAMVQPVFAALDRLFGREQSQQESFKKLLARLVPEELRGVLLGDFLIRGPAIGTGGFAAVYVGLQISTGRKVAIKILHDGMSEETRARFRQEAVFLSRLNHPHIVRVLGQGEEPWFAPRDPILSQSLAGEPWFQEFSRSAPVKCYLAAEWIEGHTLEQVFQKQRLPHPDGAELTRWFTQAAGALAAVHEAGLIHRDVKPSNLMVNEGGDIRLLDFGIARTRDELQTIQTTPGRMLGTPAYASPEQLAARDPEGAVGPASDIYSLCATFYELFTATRLFRHDKATAQTVSTRKLQEPRPARPVLFARDLPWEIDTILIGGLERDLADRYRSMRDLERDLLHVLREEPIEYRRPSWLRRARLLYRRQRTVVNLVASFVLLAVLGAAGYIISLQIEQARTLAEKNRADQQRDLAEERFELARDTVEQMLENVSDLDLYAIPLMEQARRRLLEKALAFHEKLLQQKSDDPPSRFLVARARRKVGAIALQLNRLDQAGQALEQACAQLEALATASSAPATYREELVSALLSRAEWAAQLDRFQEAEEAARHGQEVAERLSADFPQEASYRGRLASAHRRLGQVLLKTGRPREAEEALRQGLAVHELDQQGQPALEVWQRVAGIYFDLCGLYRRQQDYRQALEAVRQGKAVLTRVPVQEERLTDPQLRERWRLVRDEGLVYFQIEEAALHLSLGDLPATEAALTQNVEIRQRLVRDFPTNPNHCHGLAVAYQGLAAFYINRGQMQLSEKFLLLALQQAERLAEGYADDARFLDLQIRLQDSLADKMIMDIARRKEAESRLQDWLQLWERRRKARPDTPWNQLGVSVSQFNLGKLFMESGNAEKGAALLQQSMQSITELVRSNPQQRTFRIQQAKRQAYVAFVLMQNGATAQAEAPARQAVAGWSQLAGEQPDVTEFTNEYAAALVMLADILAQRGRLDEAEQTYLQALGIQDRLHQDWPHVASYQGERGTIHSGLADLHVKRKRWDDAAGEYERAREILVQACREFPDWVSGRIHLYTTYHNLGWVRLNQDRLEEAAQAYGQAAEISAELDRQGRTPAAIETATALNWTMVGLTQRDRKAYQEAKAAFRQALAAWERTAQRTGTAKHRFELAVTHARLGDALWSLEELSDADKEFAAAIDGLRELVKQYPDEEEFRSRLAMELNHRGTLLDRIRETDAGPAFASAVTECDRLVRKNPKNVSYRDQQVRYQANLARWQASHGMPKEAEENHRQACERWGRLAEEVPKEASYRTEFAHEANNLGYFLQTQQRPAEAVPFYRKAENEWCLQVARRPKDTEPRVELARTRTNLFVCFQSLNDPKEALRALRGAIEQRQVLVKEHPPMADQRSYLADNLKGLAELLLAEKQPAEAATIAGQILALPAVKDEELVQAARLLARCTFSADPKAGEWKQQALAALSQAARNGWRISKELQESPDFADWKKLPEFQKLLAEVPKP